MPVKSYTRLIYMQSMTFTRSLCKKLLIIKKCLKKLTPSTYMYLSETRSCVMCVNLNM